MTLQLPFTLNLAQERTLADAADLLLRRWAEEAGIDLKTLGVQTSQTRAVLAVAEAYLEGYDQDLADQVADVLRVEVPPRPGER